MYQKLVSASTISRRFHEYGYKSILSQSIHILISDEKYRRLQWAKRHKNDDVTRTILTDDASFQVFRNTVRRWTKTPHNELTCSPKNRQKILISDVVSMKGILTYHMLRCNLDDPYYASILEDYLIPAVRRK